MKSLKTIQTLSKIGKTLSKIAFIFSVIGSCGCIIGLLSTVIGSGKNIKLGGVTLHVLISDKYGYNVKKYYRCALRLADNLCGARDSFKVCGNLF